MDEAVPSVEKDGVVQHGAEFVGEKDELVVPYSHHLADLKHHHGEDLRTWLSTEVGTTGDAVAGAMVKIGVENLDDLRTSAFDREVRDALMFELARSGESGLKILHRKKLERALVQIRRQRRRTDYGDSEELLEDDDLTDFEAARVAQRTSNMARARQELCEWHKLLTSGVVSDEEFVTVKRQLLNGGGGSLGDSSRGVGVSGVELSSSKIGRDGNDDQFAGDSFHFSSSGMTSHHKHKMDEPTEDIDVKASGIQQHKERPASREPDVQIKSVWEETEELAPGDQQEAHSAASSGEDNAADLQELSSHQASHRGQSLRDSRWKQALESGFEDGSLHFSQVGRNLTLWERCAVALQSPQTGAEDVTSLISTYLSTGDANVDKFGVFNISAWHEAQKQQARYIEVHERTKRLQPQVRRLQWLIGPTVRLMKFMTACGADGDLGFIVFILMAAIMIATFPLWMIHFTILRILKHLGEESRKALDDLDALGQELGRMCFARCFIVR